jgi:AcrR family transcriptional regulator
MAIVKQSPDAEGASTNASSAAMPTIDEPPRMEELLAVSARLFDAKGYRATSLADIGEALGMNKASLYYYVRSKEDLLRRLILRASRRLRDASHDIGVGALPPDQALERLVREHCRVVFEHRTEFGLLVLQRRFLGSDVLGEVSERESAYVGHLRQVIARGIEQGVFRAMDSGIATQLVLDTVNGLLRWYSPGGRMQGAAVADELWNYVRQGLQPLHATDNEHPK